MSIHTRIRTILVLPALGLAMGVFALIATAQTTRNTVKVECALCHSAHGGFSFLINQADVEQLCQSCHGPGGIATQGTVHYNARTRYPAYRISCLGCHNPHYDLFNQLGTKNIELISNVRDDVNGAKIQTPANDNGPCNDPAPGGGCFRFQVFADRILTGAQSNWASTAPPYRGACNVCHTRTSHHRNNDLDPNADHTHNINKVCTSCHLHTKGFIK